MRKSSWIILLAALVCTGIACKKNESSLNNETEKLSVAAQEAQIVAEFERLTGLESTNQTPINADNPLEFATAQEAANYVNAILRGGQSQLELSEFGNLPVPEDEGDQICYTCRTVKVIGSIPFHASILVGYLRFKRLGPEIQYSFISDVWMLAGVHLGLDTTTPIWMNFSGPTKFRFKKLLEYYVGFRLKGFDVSFSIPVWVSGNGDVNDGTIGGMVEPAL